jgi:hypothetical protein
MSKRLLLASRLVPYGLTIAVWWYYAVFAAIPYWQETGDYSWYALSHAFTLESIYAHSPALNTGYGAHPGLPFGFLSWVAFRLTALGIPTPGERMAYVADHAETFWLYAKTIALLINLAGIYALQRGAGRNMLLFWTSFLVYFAMVPVAIETSLVQFTNESLALLFIVVVYVFAGRRYFVAAAETSPSRSVMTRHLAATDGLAFMIGALGAFGWSIKIYYLAPIFGLAFGLLVACALGSISWRSLVRSAIAAMIGFAIPFAIIIALTMGRPGLVAWASWNWSMLSHVSNYGSGATGFADLGNMTHAAEDLTAGTGLRFPIIFAAITLAALAFVAGRMADPVWRAKSLPLFLALAFGLAINVLGLLKHYSPRYALPVCATLSCLVLLLNQYLTPRALAISTFFAAVFAAFNLVAFASGHAAMLKVAHEIIEDEQQIARLPLAPGQKRVWGYYSAVKAAEIPMIVAFSGSTLASKGALPQAQSADTLPPSDPAATDWKYVMFPKFVFPTRDSIAASYLNRDFGSAKFRIGPDDTITDLKQFFVLTIPPQKGPPEKYRPPE